MNKDRVCKRCQGTGTIDDKNTVNWDQYLKRVFSCFDCGRQSCVNFMVTNEVWALTGCPTTGSASAKDYNDGILCLGCVEKRIKRPLTVNDFDLSIPINYPLAFGFAMGVRETVQAKIYGERNLPTARVHSEAEGGGDQG